MDDPICVDQVPIDVTARAAYAHTLLADGDRVTARTIATHQPRRGLFLRGLREINWMGAGRV